LIFFVFQATEAELNHQVNVLADQCSKLDASLQKSNSDVEEFRMKLMLQRQPLQFVSDPNQSMLQTLQQRIAANKVCLMLASVAYFRYVLVVYVLTLFVSFCILKMAHVVFYDHHFQASKFSVNLN